MLGGIFSRFARLVTSTRTGSSGMSSEPVIHLYKGPFEFIPGDWYRTLGPVYLRHYSPDMVTWTSPFYDGVGGYKSLIPGLASRGGSNVILLPKKTDVLLVDIRPFDIQFLPNQYRRLFQIVFLIESEKFGFMAGDPGYIYNSTFNRLVQSNWSDPIYNHFRPSRAYPNFCRVMYDQGTPRKRAGANLAGLKERIKM